MYDIILSYGIINSSQGMGRGYGPILFLLVMVLLIIFTVFIVFINKRVSGSNGNNIKVLERFYVANDKNLMVFSFNHVYYLVSSDKSGIRLIDKFNEDDVDVEFMTGKFENKFSNIMNKLSKQGLEDDKK